MTISIDIGCLETITKEEANKLFVSDAIQRTSVISAISFATGANLATDGNYIGSIFGGALALMWGADIASKVKQYLENPDQYILKYHKKALVKK